MEMRSVAEVVVVEAVARMMVAVVVAAVAAGVVKGVSVFALIMFRCYSVSKGAVFYEK